MNTPSQPTTTVATPMTKRNVWPIFISYRRSDATRKIALELKKELEASTIEAATGQTFALDVFVDVAEAHQSDFQANLVPHLQHSRALIVLADDGAASRKNDGSVDYLYSELDWWATERRKTPPIILQIDAKAGSRLVADAQFSGWRKVSFMDCFWEMWGTKGDGGAAEKQQLLVWLRESIRNYGVIIHLEEVRRLKRRAQIAWLFAGAALIAGLAAGVFARYYAKEKASAERNLVVANSNLADSYAQRGDSLAQTLDFTTSQLFFSKALELKPDSVIRDRMSRAWRPQSKWLWTASPPKESDVTVSSHSDVAVSLAVGSPETFIVGYESGMLAVCDSSGSFIAQRKTPSAITSVAFIGGLSQVVTAHDDNHLRIWRAGTLVFLKEVKLPAKPLVVKTSPTEELIAVGYSDAGIAFFSVPNFEVVDSADAHGMGVSAIAFDTKRAIAYWGGGGEYVWISDLQEKSAQRGLPKRGWTRVLSMQPSGQYLNVGGQDRIVGLIDIDKGQSLKAEETDSEISASCFSPDGQTLAVGDVAGKVRLFSMKLGKAFANLPRHPGKITDLLIDKDATVISACSDGRLRAWTLPSQVTTRFNAPASSMKKAFQEFKKETGQDHILDVQTGRYDSPVVGIVFNAVDAPLKAILSDGQMCSWTKGSDSPDASQLTGPPFGQAVSGRTERIAVLTGLLEKDLEVFDLRNSNVSLFKERISKGLGAYTPVAISGDGKRVACALTNGAVKVWAVSDGSALYEIPPNGSPPATISLSEQGDAIAVGYRNGRAVFRPTNGVMADLGGLGASPIVCSLLANSSHVVLGTTDRVYCYDPVTKVERWVFEAKVISLALDSASQWIACGTRDGEIQIINLDTGSRIITFERESEGAECIAFDESGNYIAWGDRRGRTFVRSVEALRSIHSATPQHLVTKAIQYGGFMIQGAEASLLREGKAQ